LQKNETYLVWLARVYLSLPLPKDWVYVYNTVTNRIEYRNEHSDQDLPVHPSYYYIED
jgi:hypothetical protein